MVTVERVDEDCDQERASVCDGGGSIILQRKVEIMEPITGGISPERAGDERAKYGKAEESSEKEEMQDGSTPCQARDWSQRDRDVKISTCHLRVVVGRGGALNIYPSQRQRQSGYAERR